MQFAFQIMLYCFSSSSDGSLALLYSVNQTSLCNHGYPWFWVPVMYCDTEIICDLSLYNDFGNIVLKIGSELFR